MPQVIDWPEQVRDKVREASHTILCCWEDWDAIAGQDAQVQQSTDAYFDAMYAQLDTVLLGLLDDVLASKLPTVKIPMSHTEAMFLAGGECSD